MRSVRILLLILLAILAINAATLRVPLREFKRNTTAALYRRSRTSIPLKSKLNAVFIGVVKFGTPEQTFYLVFDTGSFYTAVADSTCTDCGNPPSIPLYNGGDSTTFHDLEQPFSVEFVGGTSISGTWTLDVATFGDIKVHLPFGRINQMRKFGVSLGYSGVVGLSIGDPTKFNPYPFPSTIQTFNETAHLDEKVIGCRFVKDNPNQAGEIVIGGVDTTYVDGTIYYTPVIEVNGQPDWVIPIADLRISGRSIAKGKNALIDTGLSLVMMPGRILEALYFGTGARRMLDGIWVVPDPFPSDVTFVIGERQFLIPKNDIPRREAPKYGNLYESNIQEGGEPDGSFFYMGIPFIANHYVAFHFGKNAIGLGKRSDYPPAPLPRRIPDLNPKASEAAKSLINELWPDFEERVRLHPVLADNYARVLETFEEAALQAGDVAKTRIGKELLARITEGKVSRDDVANLLRIEYGSVDAQTVAMAATEVTIADQDPKMTNEAVQFEVTSLLSTLGLRIQESYRDLLTTLRRYTVSLMIMSLIVQKRNFL